MDSSSKVPAQNLIDSLLDESPGGFALSHRQVTKSAGPSTLVADAGIDVHKTVLLPSRPGESNEVVDRKTSTELRPQSEIESSRIQSPRKQPLYPSSALLGSADATLKQSEALRIAQSRITQLENEVEKLRRENEKLTAAGDALRRRADEQLSRAENAEMQMREVEKIKDEEVKLFRSQLMAKEREASEHRSQIEELERRLDVNFKKIRVRERELEHRLEIVKMESATLASAKDKNILELKRQIDQLNHEVEHSKIKSQELFTQFRENQETSRRVVRALRIALTMMEGEEKREKEK